MPLGSPLWGRGDRDVGCSGELWRRRYIIEFILFTVVGSWLVDKQHHTDDERTAVNSTALCDRWPVLPHRNISHMRTSKTLNPKEIGRVFEIVRPVLQAVAV